VKRDLSERLATFSASSGLIKGLADPLYNLLNKLLQETPLRPLKLFANGTWLQHPLHPLLTDVPVGAWTLAIVLELIALILGVPNLGLASAIAIGLGVLAALAAMATGFMDWMDVDPPEKALGMLHAILNVTSTLLFLIALWMLWGDGWGVSLPNFAVALVAYLIISAGAFIGGDLVYRMGAMVNRNAYRTGPKAYTNAMALSDLPENQPKRVEVKGQPILLLRRGDKIYAVGAVCSHYGGPLEKGKLVDNSIQCPYHYSRFSLDSGVVKEGPSSSPLPAYDTQVADGQIQVRMRN
jgi:nitrite reductase/ring-hydroxylating ferredoxin subunit/uncharacterized membrane protein